MSEKTSAEKNARHFQENIDLSYIPENTPNITALQIWKHYFSSLFLYGLGFLLISHNNWYLRFTTNALGTITVLDFFFYLLLAYAFFAPLVFFLTSSKDLWFSKPILIVGYLIRSLAAFFPSQKWLKKFFLFLTHKYKDKKNPPQNIYTDASAAPVRKERQAIIFFLIKIFFAPQMLQYAFGNLGALTSLYHSLQEDFLIIITNIGDIPFSFWLQFQDRLYFFLIPFLFFLDVFFFAFGYIWEAPFLKNKLRSVDDTFLGVMACLMCYVPFNNATNTFLGWVPNDHASFFADDTSLWTWIFRWTAIVFLVIYVAASVALFTRASNLTNRGIVSRFPYNIVRHPAYIAKNMNWWLLGIPFIVTVAVAGDGGFWEVFSMILSLMAWTGIYCLRAYTEERHLSQDPDYIAYKKKVKWRFIPKVW